MDVYVLTYDSSVVDVFDNRRGAEKRIVSDALNGVTIEGAAITMYPVVRAVDPLAYPGVVEQIRIGRKILAVKYLREAVPGTSLMEAKNAIESVWCKVMSSAAAFDMVVPDDDDPNQYRDDEPPF